MPDIFQDTHVPAWLANIARPIDTHETGKVFGELVGGMANAYDTAKAKQDQGIDTSWVREIPGGLKEANLNLADPFWKLQVQRAQLGMAQQKFNLDSEQQKLEWMKGSAIAKNKELENELADAEYLSPYLASSPQEQARMEAEGFQVIARSMKGVQLVANAKRYQDMNQVRQTMAENQSAVSKIAVNTAKQFMESLDTVTDPAEKNRILGLMKNNQPTDDAWAALNLAPKTDKKVEQAKAIEEVKQQNRVERDATKQKYAIEIQNLKNSARVDKNGKRIGYTEFFNRHYNAMFNRMWQDTGDAKKASAATTELLDEVYNQVSGKEESLTPPAQPAAPVTAPGAATTPVQDGTFSVGRFKVTPRQ